MAKKSKRYLMAKKKIDKNKEYSLPEAIKLIKEISNCHFEESVELAVSLNIKPKEKGERVRGTVVLPHGLGKQVKVVVFAEGEKAEEAKQKGADYVGGEELIKKIEKGWLDFDATVSTPQMMRMVAKLGRILGPRGLMPSPKVGTVTLLENIKALLASLIKDKPSTVKGRYIRGLSLCSTMGPGIRINLQKALEML